MSQILSVATAGLRPGQLSDVLHQQYPRIDYVELQALLKANTLDYSLYDHGYTGRFFRNLEIQLGTDLYLSTISWIKSRRHSTVFAWSERAGIPMAAYRRISPSRYRFVSMFQCWSKRQETVIRNLGLFQAMDQIIVHCESMRRNLVHLGAPAEKVHTIHYSVDQCFFSPQPGSTQTKNLIMSIGETRSRDYNALFQAVDGLPVSLHLPAFGHWYAREKHIKMHGAIPDNVTLIQHLAQVPLRDLYSQSQFVVLPVRNLVYSAGATAALEAACMARAVIAFRSAGISDYIIDGETGILVEPGDVQALRDAILHLNAHPQEAKRLGDNARQRVEQELNFENYVNGIAKVLTEES